MKNVKPETAPQPVKKKRFDVPIDLDVGGPNVGTFAPGDSKPTADAEIKSEVKPEDKSNKGPKFGSL